MTYGNGWSALLGVLNQHWFLQGHTCPSLQLFVAFAVEKLGAEEKKQVFPVFCLWKQVKVIW